MTPNRDYSAMSSDEILSADTSDWIAILPLGAHEQHGPHLPFETDSIIAGGIACKLSEALPENLPVTFLPTERVGYSIEHMNFNGSKTLGYDEAIHRWISIGGQLSEQGLRKLILLNAHGGNSPLMTIVATELRVRFDMLCVTTSWTRFIVSGDVISDDEKKYGIHGGDIETSVMLALEPQQVDMSKAEEFPSFQKDLTENTVHLRAYGPHAFGWKMQDLNPKGVTGDATAATIEKGEALINQAVKGLAELVADVHRFNPEKLI